MDTKRCFCGTLILAEWVDCGTPECMKQSESLAADEDYRRWRFKSVLQMVPYNRVARHETQKRVQMASVLTARVIKQDLADENLRRLHRRLKVEDSIPEDFDE